MNKKNLLISVILVVVMALMVGCKTKSDGIQLTSVGLIKYANITNDDKYIKLDIDSIDKSFVQFIFPSDENNRDSDLGDTPIESNSEVSTNDSKNIFDTDKINTIEMYYKNDLSMYDINEIYIFKELCCLSNYYEDMENTTLKLNEIVPNNVLETTDKKYKLIDSEKEMVEEYSINLDKNKLTSLKLYPIYIKQKSEEKDIENNYSLIDILLIKTSIEK